MVTNYKFWDEVYGKIVEKIDYSKDEFVLSFTDGTQLKFYHEQYCCEKVYITQFVFSIPEIKGFASIIGKELKSIKESYKKGEWEYGTYTETKLEFDTSCGKFEVHWYGESNGWYDENVSFQVSTVGN